jgi:hypothetical protein
MVQIVGVLDPERIHDPESQRAFGGPPRPVDGDEGVDEEQRAEREAQRHDPKLREL